MKTLKKVFNLCAPLVLLVSSCTIDKRLYTSGYNVQWHNSKQYAVKSQIVKDTSERGSVEKINFQEVQNVKPKINNANNGISDKNLIASSDKFISIRNYPAVFPRLKTKKAIRIREEKKLPLSAFKQSQNSIYNEQEHDAHSYALTSMILGILSFIPGLGFYIGMFAIIKGIMAVHEIKNESYDPFDFITIALLSIFTLQIPLIVMGIKALIQLKKEPKSKEKKMAKAGILCGIIGILLNIALLAYIVITISMGGPF